MLTANELTWLKRRKLYAGVNRWSHYSCQWCEHLNVNREGFRTPCGASIYGCPCVDMEGDNDDVDFEARVAALIAKLYADKFADVVLKHARLAVEEEMGNEP